MKKRACLGSIAVWLLAGAHAQLSAQVTPPATPPRTQVIAAAKEIMQAARYCTLITIGSGGQPQARIVDPFPPEEDLTIFLIDVPQAPSPKP